MDVAFYDRAGRSRLIVTGQDRKDLLHRLATNPVAQLQRGEGIATCFCTSKGRLIDWSVVLDRGDDLLVLTANPERLAGHIQLYTISEDVTVRNYMAIEIVVCGPDAARLLEVELEPWWFAERDLAGVRVEIARIEPLWTDAYAILAPDAVALRRLLAEQGRLLDPYEVNQLRVDAGIPAFPNEINERHNPWEAGLADSVSLNKGCYIGQEVIARLNAYEKIQRRLARIECLAVLEAGDALTLQGEACGEVTTVAGNRALGYVAVASARPGTRLDQGIVEWVGSVPGSP